MTVGGEGDALDCFVSYAEDGQPWAEWITGTLENAGLRVLVESWDRAPGTHQVSWLDRATRQARYTIAVVSDGYLDSPTAVTEWGAAWSPRVADGDRRLLVARVTDRPVPGLLGQIAPVNLFDRGALAGETALLAAVRGGEPGPPEGAAPRVTHTARSTPVTCRRCGTCRRRPPRSSDAARRSTGSTRRWPAPRWSPSPDSPASARPASPPSTSGRTAGTSTPSGGCPPGAPHCSATGSAPSRRRWDCPSTPNRPPCWPASTAPTAAG
nr:TIR domain-containing protein [Frankia sp. ArI3]